MIKGITHDIDGVINTSESFRGKISTGYAPGEAPGGKNSGPISSGFFRILREEVTTMTVPGSTETKQIKKWIVNAPMQGILNQLDGKDKPTLMAFTCMFQDPSQLWETYMGKFLKSGLVCKSQGLDTIAEEAVFDAEGNKSWRPRKTTLPDGTVTNKCQLQDCPDYKNKECKPHGCIKVFPQFDLSTSPYKFETQSEIAIKQIEAMLNRIWSLLKTSHAIRCREANEQLEFDGMLGTQWFLRIRSVKTSHGSAFITELLPSKALNNFIMTPIRSELERMQKLQLEGKSAAMISAGTAAIASQGVQAIEQQEFEADDSNDVAGFSAEDIGDESAPAEVIASAMITRDEFAAAAAGLMGQ